MTDQNNPDRNDPDRNDPENSDQILHELDATLNSFIASLKSLLTISKTLDQKLDRNNSKVEIVKLIVAIDKLTLRVNQLPQSNPTQIDIKFKDLESQIAAIPTAKALKPKLANLATNEIVVQLSQRLQYRDSIGIAALGAILMMMFVLAWGITDTKNKLQQQIEKMPESLLMHQIQQQEAERAIQQYQQNAAKKKKK